jgi:hypothetical protein
MGKAQAQNEKKDPSAPLKRTAGQCKCPAIRLS